MKIDFNAGYKGVSELVFRKEASSADPSVRAQFGRMIRQAEQSSLKELEIIKKDSIFENTVEQREAQTGGVRSSVQSYHTPPPTTVIPGLERHSVGIEPVESVNMMPEAVKTPTVLEVRRISPNSTPEPMASLRPTSTHSGEAQFQEIIHFAGGKHGVDPALGLAVARAESSFNPNAVSMDGHASKGLFQLLDTTGKDMMSRLSVSGSYDPFNPELNTNLGVGYLRYLHDLFSTEKMLPNKLKTQAAANSSSLEKLAVAAFNAGEGRVASAQRQATADGLDASEYSNVESYLPTITQDYVKNVTRYRDEYDRAIDPEFNG